MYVNLYPNRQLRATKRSVLLMGLFLLLGGGYALLRELLWMEALRPGWAAASGLMVLSGSVCLAYATEVLRFKDAFFSMTPERIAYRVSLFGSETVVEWQHIQELRITEHYVSFALTGGAFQKIRLGAIQSPDIARHVARSIHLAGLEKGIMINGIKPSPSEPALQV
ncbi:hypothetical protein [Pontibacter mangrovi]|uniref:DUF304 domain-containing protein n=1 Tax=Pontibacter mangrovi TaxID=2589816 RepID=A0A501W4I8_9BACT|nr:hypothetical protein [Pontibacter mangrovi]TPE43702.1 hypothetical protein FJM65_13225 [Pontibacter mangrovi]